MSIYKTLIEKVENGGSFKIDLKQKSLKINGKIYIENGEVKIDDDLILESDLECFENCVTQWRNMIWYLDYKHSVPSKNKKYSKSYFKALNYEELPLSDLSLNETRYLSQAKSEGYILLGVLKGWLNWDLGDYWFWQCPTDKDLVVLKEWF